MKGELDNGEHFAPLGKPMGGDALYGCGNCQSRLILVYRTARRPEFRVVSEADAILTASLPENQPTEGVPRILTDDARQALRRAPYTLSAKEVSELRGKGAME
jgi:hypothetical protein